jgi:hypothetical protein
MKSALPKPIRSKNPVVILKHVIKVIREEPRRYNQGTWRTTTRSKDAVLHNSDYFPKCGTVCCVAGWVNHLTGQRAHGFGNSGAARKTLGLTLEEARALFDGEPHGVQSRWRVDAHTHANQGIKHIKRFVLKKWGKKI